MDICRLVVTGGPCAGKTTALECLKTSLLDEEYEVLVVPEAATALIAAGVAPWTVGPIAFQTAVLELQRAQEDVISAASLRLAAPDRAVVICDRGIMDGCAYITDEEFAGIAAAHGLTEDDILSRYEAVFHLTSAAAGLESVYTNANNASRYEDVDGAVAVEERTLYVWRNHPHRTVIGNEDRFEDKVAHFTAEVLAWLKRDE